MKLLYPYALQSAPNLFQKRLFHLAKLINCAVKICGRALRSFKCYHLLVPYVKCAHVLKCTSKSIL